MDRHEIYVIHFTLIWGVQPLGCPKSCCRGDTKLMFDDILISSLIIQMCLQTDGHTNRVLEIQVWLLLKAPEGSIHTHDFNQFPCIRSALVLCTVQKASVQNLLPIASLFECFVSDRVNVSTISCPQKLGGTQKWWQWHVHYFLTIPIPWCNARYTSVSDDSRQWW